MEDNRIKYPRTEHIPSSPGATNDDKISKLYPTCFIGKRVIISEKRDGENSTMMRDYCYARSIDSNNHPSRNWLKGLWGNIRFDIPEDWRICGENLYAKHSIGYNELDTYFEVFNIWNEDNHCISWDDMVQWCELLSLKHVPVIYDGIFDESAVEFLIKYIDIDKVEGFVIRLAESFKYEDFNKSVVKWVREGHVQTDKHWSTQKIEPNKLK